MVKRHDGYYLCRKGGPGTIVIEEYWGLVDHIKDINDGSLLPWALWRRWPRTFINGKVKFPG